jgi:hypothetical protein
MSAVQPKDPFPDFETFRTHVIESIMYPDEDLALLRKYCVKAGFKNLDEYLELIYHRTLDLEDKVLDKYNSKLSNPDNLKSGIIMSPGNLLTLSVFKEKYRKRSESAYDRFKKFPKKVKEQLKDIEFRFNKSLISLTLEKNEHDPLLCGMFIKGWKCFYEHLMRSNPSSPIGKDMLDYIKTLTQDELVDEIKKLTNAFFYFPEKIGILEKLHDGLLNEKLILKNENFKSSFALELPSKEELTAWTGKQPQSLYLLYLLADEKNHFNGLPLNIIAIRLFKYKAKNVSKKSLATVLNRLPKFIKDKEYYNSKLLPIKDIFTSVLKG